MDYRRKIQAIRSEYLRGRITYEEAKKMVEPLLVEMNDKGMSIAHQSGFKFRRLTFGYVFR